MITVKPTSVPKAPTLGNVVIYAKGDGNLYALHANGREVKISAQAPYTQVQAPDIAWGAIQGDHVALRELRADHIVAGSITANEIAARTITADRIVARTITANEITSQTITANEIAANTITGGQISASAKITVGTGNNVAVLDGADAAYRLYVGNATPSNAPFWVKQDGTWMSGNSSGSRVTWTGSELQVIDDLGVVIVSGKGLTAAGVRRNWVGNPSFELYNTGDTAPTGWVLSLGATYNTSASQADGLCTITLPGASPAPRVLYSTSPLNLPIGRGVLSCYARCASTQSTSGRCFADLMDPTQAIQYATGSMFRVDPNGTVSTNTPTVPNDDTWYRYYIYVNITSAGTVACPRFYNNLVGGGTIEIDRVKFEFEAGATTNINPTPYINSDWGMAYQVRNLAAENITAGFLNAARIQTGSLSGDKITATSKITAGSGNNVGVLDGADATYRIYAGNATPASAPFRVTQAGALTATNATITGAITATSGSFTGTVSITGSGKLTAGSGTVTLDVNGVAINQGSGASNKLRWLDGSAELGSVYTTNGAGFGQTIVRATDNAGTYTVSGVILQPQTSDTGPNAYVTVSAQRATIGSSLSAFRVTTYTGSPNRGADIDFALDTLGNFQVLNNVDSPLFTIRHTGGMTFGGTSFPSTPVTNDLFYRTDRDLLYYYDGTRWLTVHEYEFVFTRQVNTASYTVRTVAPIGRLDHRYATYISSISMRSIVATTNTAANYWTLTLNTMTLAGAFNRTIYGAATSSDTVNVYTEHNWTTGFATVLATETEIYWDWQLTGAPGALTVDYSVKYRLIG